MGGSTLQAGGAEGDEAGRTVGFRVRRSISVAPGVRLTVSRSGVGVSAGVKGARQAVRRIEPVIRARMRMEVQAGVAAFPDDGFTLTELMEIAENDWRRQALEVHPASIPGSRRPQE
jgi:hypothetical protein